MSLLPGLFQSVLSKEVSNAVPVAAIVRVAVDAVIVYIVTVKTLTNISTS